MTFQITPCLPHLPLPAAGQLGPELLQRFLPLEVNCLPLGIFLSTNSGITVFGTQIRVS